MGTYAILSTRKRAYKEMDHAEEKEESQSYQPNDYSDGDSDGDSTTRT